MDKMPLGRVGIRLNATYKQMEWGGGVSSRRKTETRVEQKGM
jgi:hypothetical protein